MVRFSIVYAIIIQRDCSLEWHKVWCQDAKNVVVENTMAIERPFAGASSIILLLGITAMVDTVLEVYRCRVANMVI